ncbi:MAG: hypothetical protein ABWY58_02155 [Aeromicrobium sp.]
MPSTIDSSPENRLPAVAEPEKRWALVAQGAAALVGTIAIVVGVPIGLLAAFGTPWPDEKPSADWLTTPTTGETVLAVLAVVVWLAWAHFVVCLLVEAVAERRKSGLAPHIPGGGIGTQSLARRLISSIVLLAAVTSVGMSSANAVTAAPDESVQAAPTSQVVSSTVSQIVMPAELPDGTLPTLGDLERATDTDVATGVTTYYDVKPPNGRHYDTLWDIADRYLGDGRRYQEIWDLNKGVEQPDGRVLQKADLIHPGWVMKLPNDAKGPGLKVVDHATVADVPVQTPAPAGQAGATAQATSAADGPTTQADGGGLHVDGDWAPFFGVAGGLVLAGAFLGLRRRRASATAGEWWATRDPSGTDPHDPVPTPPTPGSRLRDEADVTTASWLDRAVRSLNSRPGFAAPARASLSEQGLAMVFDDAPTVEPPDGWTSSGSVWSLQRDAVVGGSGLSPLPGLVSIGRRDDGTVFLLDTESVDGVIALDGDVDVARGLALSMAVDAATHPWADDRAVTLVGFADDLSHVGAGSIRHADDVGRVLEGLDNVARYQRAACRDAGADSARAARASRPDAIDWSYQLIVCSGSPSPDELARLSELAADPTVALGVVIVGSAATSGLRLTSRPDGRVSSPMAGIDVTAQVLTVDAVHGLVALHEPAAGSQRVSMDQLVDALVAEHRVAAEHESVARVRILGPVEVSAPGEVDPDRRELLTELACFLAIHPTGVHANRVSAALWPRGVEPEVRDTALGQLSTWLGTTSDGGPVLQQQLGIWSFAPGAVDLDWTSFRDALNRASDDGARRETHLRAALDLVEGPAFDGIPSSRYGWLAATTLESDIAMAVNLTVLAAAEAAAVRDDEDAARAALARGLRMSPASEELWRSRLRLESHVGSRDDLEAAVGEMYAAIAEHGSPIGSAAETDALVDELLPGYRTRVA